ncbi:MAG: phospho-N-acetylmuramoyl-pentapeptide-transferase [Bacilli bacterium]|nr:phospho-N-acetylmuramoyl-pentapeptide-transferase [Bacilli bacterium]
MFVLTKSVLAMMISFILAVLLGLFLIPILKKLKASQRVSVYVSEMHKQKNGTPTMGGLIFIVPVIMTVVILYLLGKINFSYNLLIIVFTFISYSLIGFLDDYLIIKRNNNKGLTEIQKLLLQIIVAIIFFYLFMKGGNEPLIWIRSLNLRIEMGWLYGLFILFILVSSSNAVNITDGLDGLAGGLSVIAFLTFGIIAWSTGWLEGYDDIAVFCFILIGGILGFLVFNLNPAKVFMGDTGSLALGATLGAVAIITRYEFLLILIGIVFVLETLSCVIQIIYFKLTGKRFFPMTPIHHSFEKIGFKETDIVKMFLFIGLLASMIAIILCVWI